MKEVVYQDICNVTATDGDFYTCACVLHGSCRLRLLQRLHHLNSCVVAG